MYIDSVHICIQFQDVGSHGTKVVVYNLWMNDDGLLELDFDDDDEVSVHIFLHCNYTMALHIVLVVPLRQQQPQHKLLYSFLVVFYLHTGGL